MIPMDRLKEFQIDSVRGNLSVTVWHTPFDIRANVENHYIVLQKCAILSIYDSLINHVDCEVTPEGYNGLQMHCNWGRRLFFGGDVFNLTSVLIPRSFPVQVRTVVVSQLGIDQLAYLFSLAIPEEKKQVTPPVGYVEPKWFED